MAIKFEEKDGDNKPKPIRKEVGAKVDGAEEPSTDAPTPGPLGELPFGKPIKPEKKGRRK